MSDRSFTVSRRHLLHASAAAGAAAVLLGPARSDAQQLIAGRDLMKDKRPIRHPGGSAFGCYDPYGDFSEDKGLATEHLFLPWEDVELGSLGAADDYARARGRNILITIEPWSWSLSWNVRPRNLRDLILSGKRDANMQAILDAVSGFKSPITIRWAQEMDNLMGRFSWSGWEPRDYIAAYRRMGDMVRKTLPQARLMWSPKGQKTLRDYYPGGDHVDVVGLSVFGLEAYDKIAFKRPRSFAETLKQGYDLTVGYGKPIMVAELGYDGGLDYVAKWVQEATLAYPQYPALKEVVYFNDKEVWPWPYGLGLPNWRVARDKPIYPVR